MRQSYTYIWQAFLLFLFFLLGSVVSSCLMFLASFLGVDINSVDNQLWIQAVNQLLSFGAAAWLYAVYFKFQPVALFQFRCQSNTLLLALTGAACFLCLLPAIDWVSIWNDSLHLPGNIGASIENSLRSVAALSEQILNVILSRTDVLHLVLNIVVLALLPAICEEMFFRGALQNVFIRWIGNKHYAILITAVIFSLAHGDLFAFVPRLLLGVLLGYLFLYSGSLVVSSLAHFVNNLIVVIVYYLSATGVVDVDPSAPMCFSWLTTLLASLLSAFLLFLFFMSSRKDESLDNIKNQE